MPTIIDVAKRAGVSKSTVSKILTDKPYVSHETREKVMKAIAELGYRPNAIARSLVRNVTKTIGLIISDITNPFFPEIVRGIEDKASEMGYNIFICNSDAKVEREEAYLELLLEKRVDGIIFTSARITDTRIADLRRHNFPFILVSRTLPDVQTDYVVVDNRAGAYLAVEHLISLGHQRIAHITGPKDASGALDRLWGYQKAMADHGLKTDAELVKEGDFREQGGYLATKELLSLSSAPTAIFAANDFIAIGALQAINEAGLEVPEDISLVGFDNIHLAGLTRINLTTINQPRYKMGLMATEVLIERIEGKRGPGPVQLVLEPELVIRSSTKRLAG
ncbi:MAG: Catabolite control protein A [Actinobacteria bacterium]|nr:Catabolite control protein A [Actinomycetota bacterium]